ncbi:EEF1A lysine methyltransferase 1 [Boleophthalmus pectinirostris]|uniref:EEF1A lysine methyltransferase 1 n=1 Tax=Boleophthalmus pectinirostris TaxID=150288 RepID=UPI00242B0E45|nr:EEF1A lysine methyltransferase 1 [Boleophthalmus pectinirostris]
MMSDSEEDVPTLSTHTLAALQEFYAETLGVQSLDPEPTQQFAVGALGEDWGLSQFWYSEDTARQLAEELVQEAGPGGRIACVSAPSVYQKLKQGVVAGSEDVSVQLLEYDRRFASYGDDFIFYDYHQPLALPAHVHPHSFDVVLADPPYLSHECLSKVAQTVRYLSKGKVLLCTGAVMQSTAKELLDVDMCDFLPQHHRNLSNDFRCYTNYPSSGLSAGAPSGNT